MDFYYLKQATERLEQIGKLPDCKRCFILQDAKSLVKNAREVESACHRAENKFRELESEVRKVKRELKVAKFNVNDRDSVHRVRNALSASVFDKCEKCGVPVRRDYDFCYNCGSLFIGEKVVEEEVET